MVLEEFFWSSVHGSRIKALTTLAHDKFDLGGKENPQQEAEQQYSRCYLETLQYNRSKSLTSMPKNMNTQRRHE